MSSLKDIKKSSRTKFLPLRLMYTAPLMEDSLIYNSNVLYNVTISLDPSIETDWLHWMQHTHIPDVLKSACFLRCLISKVNGNEPGECTYSVLYWAKNATSLDRYFNEFAQRLQQEHTSRYDGKFVAFRTTMNVINTLEP